MAGQTPPRHGIDWSKSRPTPAGPVGVQARRAVTPVAAPPPADVTTPVRVFGIVPVTTLHAFYQALPDPSVQQVAKITEVPWPNSITAGTKLDLASFTVPDQYVYVLTDIYYYALSPSSALDAPLIQLQPYQLSGLVRFELYMGNRTPLRIDSSTFNPYDNTTAPNFDGSGWPVLDTVFGTRRGGSFALYARSKNVVQVRAVVDVVPRFSITKLGAHFHGYAVAEGNFDEIFRRIKGK